MRAPRELVPVVIVLAGALGVGGYQLFVQQARVSEEQARAALLAAQAASAPAAEKTKERAQAGPGTALLDPRSLIRFGRPDPLPKPAGAIRLATYNVENLFDAKDDPATAGNRESRTPPKPEAELQALAKTIKALDADVLALQEIQSLGAVKAFRDRYLADLGYTHVASLDAGDERGIEQSVLSRFPITEVENWPRKELGGTHPETLGNGNTNSWRGRPIAFHRSPLRVVVEAGVEGKEPYELTLYVLHSKSGRDFGYWREAEARGVVKLVQAEQSKDPGANIFVLGDFNAGPGDASFQTLTSSLDLTDLFASREGGMESGGRGVEAVFATHESGRVIDHILASKSAVAEVVGNQRFVLGTPARPAGVDWRTTPPPAGYASDHYPVAVDLIPINRP